MANSDDKPVKLAAKRDKATTRELARPTRHRRRKAQDKAKDTPFPNPDAAGAAERVLARSTGAARADNSLQAADPNTSGGHGAVNSATKAGVVILKPPQDLRELQKTVQESSVLKQCVEAMVTNIDGHGWRLDYIGPEDGEDSAEALEEKRRIERFLGMPNTKHTLGHLRRCVRTDRESTGNAYFEVVRDKAGDVMYIYHLPAYTMRCTNTHPDAVQVESPHPMDPEDNVVEYRRFRRYVQVLKNGKQVWFKEMGDPRVVNCETGETYPLGEGRDVPANKQANEVLAYPYYTPGEVYGLPRWINQLPAIIGTRESELTNANFFRDNAIPAVVVTVAGGALTEESFSEIEDKLNSIRGRGAHNRMVVLEAAGDENAADEDGKIPPPKVEFHPLTGTQQTDALFQVYEDKNEQKIRSSFRMPPILVGRSDEYNRATANTALVVVESQMFGPERHEFDEMFEAQFLVRGGRKPLYWRFRSNKPRLVSPQDIVEALAALDTAGALNPNVVIGIANELFGLDLPLVGEAWGDKPFEFAKVLLARGGFIAGLEDMLSFGPLDDGTDDGGEEPPDEAAPLDGADNVPDEQAPPADGTGDAQPRKRRRAKA